MRSRWGVHPKGRPTLIYGSAGSGKTLLAMEFFMRRALDSAIPGNHAATTGGITELRHQEVSARPMVSRIYNAKGGGFKRRATFC